MTKIDVVSNCALAPWRLGALPGAEHWSGQLYPQAPQRDLVVLQGISRSHTDGGPVPAPVPAPVPVGTKK
jgi:hypothetical protein